MNEYLNKRQLEELFGLSTSTINRKLKDLPKIKIGNSRNSRVLFPRPEIDNLFTREFYERICKIEWRVKLKLNSPLNQEITCNEKQLLLTKVILKH